MSYLLRRLPLSRLLLLCGLVVVLGISLTALAFALGSGPMPPAKPLPEAIHDSLVQAQTQPVEGVSAQIQWSNHLLEGANLAGGGAGSGGGGGGEGSALTSSPLMVGASGRLWISKGGDVRIELQSEEGDTQIYYDGKTVSMYDAASNTLYRFTPPAHEDSTDLLYGSQSEADSPALDQAIAKARKRVDQPQAPVAGEREASITAPAEHHEPPSVAKIEEAIAKASKHVNVSGATPTDVAGQPAYTVRVSPKEAGSLLGGAELSWDAVHGVPLRAAVYSTESSTPVMELAATSISYGPVEQSVFEFKPPANAKIEEVKLPEHPGEGEGAKSGGGEPPTVTRKGHGLSSIAVVEDKTKPGAHETSPLPEGLPQVKINGISATELTTELGTLLTFERDGVRYLVAGSVQPGAVEAVAKGL